MKKAYLTLSVVSSIFLTSAAFANEIPVNLMGSATAMNSAPINIILDIVKQNIDLSSSSGNAKASVQVIYKNKKPDYLLVYLFSAKNYSFTVTKIQLNENYQVQSIISNYQLQTEDDANQPTITAPVCPDNSIEFVSSTPADTITTAKAAVENVYNDALAHHYKAVKLLGAEATVASYQNWFACPNLKGFFNIGHGDKNEIVLADGYLKAKFFAGVEHGKLKEKAVVLFNSCQVDNPPLKPSIVESSDAQKYAGGVTNLLIGPSESASQCFWAKAFNDEGMTKAIEVCNQQYDPSDQFGISGHGSDNITLPEMLVRK
ncbi:MAG: hypothetical protein JO131_08155 [Gammaproteobacteria bacterium]|nr:hypothetical protein [Gammaproteobacteria bacterium]